MLTVPTEQPRRECNTREQGHQGNYFTDSPRLRPCVDDGKRVADHENRKAKRVAKCVVRGRNINASEPNEDRIKNPVGREARGPREREGKTGA